MWLVHAFFISGSSVGEACAVRLRGFRLLFTKTLRWRSTVILHMETVMTFRQLAYVCNAERVDMKKIDGILNKEYASCEEALARMPETLRNAPDMVHYNAAQYRELHLKKVVESFYVLRKHINEVYMRVRLLEENSYRHVENVVVQITNAGEITKEKIIAITEEYCDYVKSFR